MRWERDLRREGAAINTEFPDRGERVTWQPARDFQRLMLRWRQAGPYNAARAVCLSGSGSLDRLKGAVDAVLAEAGLRCIAVDNDAGRIAWIDNATIEQDVSAATLEPAGSLEPLFAEELNRPFPDDSHAPFRFRLIREPRHNRHWIVLVYDHVVADGCGVQAMMVAVLSGYLGQDERLARVHRGLFGAPESRSSWIGGIAGAVKFLGCYLRLRHCHRLHEKRNETSEVAVLATMLEELDAHALHRYARSRRVRRSDLVLAATASAIARLTPSRRNHRRRRGIALGTVVSVRSPEPGGLSLTPQLTYGIIVVDRPEAPPDELLASIRAQTRGLRASGGQLCAASGLLHFFGSLVNFRNDSDYYRKTLPICAGVSPFVVDPQLYGESAGAVQRIFRVCPTGPVLPIVLAPTFWRSTLELVLTYRRSCMDRLRAEEFVGLVTETLRQFAADATPTSLHPAEALAASS